MSTELAPLDVIVIGAGLAGVSTAFLLQRSGRYRSVTCLDQESSVAMQTSFQNGGLLCPSLSYPWSNSSVIKVALKSILSPSPGAAVRFNWAGLKSSFVRQWWYSFVVNMLPSAVKTNYHASHRLCDYSLGLMKQELREGLEDQIRDPNIAFVANGSLQIFSSAAARDSRSIIMQSLGPSVLSLTSLDQSECCSAVPALGTTCVTRGECGLLSAGDSSGDIHAFTAWLKRRAEQMGVEFVFGVTAAGFLMRKAEAEENDSKNIDLVQGVILDDGTEMRADHVVVAAGNAAPYFAALLGDTVLSLPVKGYALEVPLMPGKPPLPYNVVDDIGKFYSAPLVKWTQGNSGWDFAGHAIRVSGFADVGFANCDIDKPRADALLSVALTRFTPGYLDADSTKFHACCRPQTPDDLPCVGVSPRYRNVWYNAGHGHIGWTRCFGSSALLVSLMSGDESLAIDPTPYSPARW